MVTEIFVISKRSTFTNLSFVTFIILNLLYLKPICIKLPLNVWHSDLLNDLRIKPVLFFYNLSPEITSFPATVVPRACSDYRGTIWELESGGNCACATVLQTRLLGKCSWAAVVEHCGEVTVSWLHCDGDIRETTLVNIKSDVPSLLRSINSSFKLFFGTRFDLPSQNQLCRTRRRNPKINSLGKIFSTIHEQESSLVVPPAVGVRKRLYFGTHVMVWIAYFQNTFSMQLVKIKGNLKFKIWLP